MFFKNKIPAGFFFIAFILSNSVYAQKILTNDLGEKIIVYEDGSWEFYKGTVDSIAVDVENIERDAPISQAEMLRQEIQQLLEKTNVKKAIIEKEYTSTITKRVTQEEHLELLYRDKKITPPLTIFEAEEALKARIMKENEFKNTLDLMIKELKELKNIQKIQEKKPQKAIEMLVKMGKLSDKDPRFITKTQKSELVEPFAPEPQKQYASYNPLTDVMLHPPKKDCSFQFDGIDEITGQKRRDVQEQLFFFFTPPALANHLNGADYLRCMGYLTQISGGYRFLSLKFVIKSNIAQQAFGGFTKNSLLNIKLLNGDNVRLLNNKDHSGTYDPIQKAYIFKAQFPISNKHFKMLSRSEVDKLRVVWDTGYEDYEIYELDFFKNQFSCLESGNK